LHRLGTISLLFFTIWAHFYQEKAKSGKKIWLNKKKAIPLQAHLRKAP
jgi:hypothetical protein